MKYDTLLKKSIIPLQNYCDHKRTSIFLCVEKTEICDS